ncbi:MAG: hypothetical protein CR986_05830 [Ignavibacteriae bacterium]|nr:MAG: hypothetical protein CR986_05830 [Ignavibacteriota bacterium]
MKKIIILFLTLGLASCSIFQSSKSEDSVTEEETNSDEVYVFNDVSEPKKEDTEIKNLEKEIDKTLIEKKDKNENKNKYEEKKEFEKSNRKEILNENLPGNNFYLQLGAFSTLSRAEQFVENIRSQVPFRLSIIYNKKNKFFTVRSIACKTKQEAENIKRELRKKSSFKDSFIITD